MNPFDQQIKDAYEGHEAPFDPSSWDELNTKLDHIAPSPIKYFAALSTGIAATGLVFLALLFVMSENQGDPASLTENVEQTEIHGEGIQTPHSTEVSAPATKSENSEVESGASAQTTPVETNEHSTTGDQGEVAVNKASEIANAQHEKASVPALTAERATLTKAANTPAPVEKSDKNKSHFLKGEKVIASTDASNNRAIHTSCAGLTIHFDASQDYGKDAKFLWNFGDGFFSNDANPSHTFNKSGTFDVSLSVTSQTTGQISSNVVQAKIEVLEAPRARTEISVPSADAVHLENVSLGDDNNEWWIDGETLKGSDVAVFELKDKIDSEIRLVVLNENGCSDTLTQYLKFRNIVEAQSFHEGSELPFQSELSNGTGALHIFDASGGKLLFTTVDGRGMDLLKSAGEYTYVYVNKEKDGAQVSRGTLIIP